MASRITGALPSNPSAQVQAVIDWMFAMCEGDWDKLESVLTEDFEATILPKSLNFPVRNKAAWIQYNKDAFPIFTDFKFHIVEIVEGVNAVAVHGCSNATTSTGHPYRNEYSLFLHLTRQSDGRYRLKQEKEFIDSQYIVEFFSAEKKRQEAAGNTVYW
ncbi:unnamed protein product [Somion occarium]|uniref:SnoaL-like domain-containing protein n=1 Tax=Somion occarium TaxID=3059160 RepID=A0ABP1EBS9_9APHY